MSITAKYDQRGFSRAVLALAQTTERETGVVLKEAAKGFVKLVQGWTPPGSPKNQGPSARKLGEAAIQADLARVFLPLAKGKPEPVNLASVHKAARSPQTGRVRKVKAGKRTLVRASELKAYTREVIKRVGWLAAGWNAAATKLGVRVPAWISRHGTSGGQIQLKLNGWNQSITITNGVDYAGSVKGLAYNVGRALDRQRDLMRRKAEWLVGRAKQKARM